MPYDKNNIFAKIIRGEIPADVVARSDHAIAFNDINPQRRVHILVIPTGPYENIFDFTANAPADEQSDFWTLVRRAAADRGVARRFDLAAHTGAPHQSVFHFHIHIMAD